MAVRRTKEGALTERVAKLLLGAPLKFDAERGTQTYVDDISINLATGRCFDLEEEVSLTHLDLIRRFKKLENGQAEAWLEQNVTGVAPLPLPAEFAAERALIGMLACQPELMAAIEEEVTVDHFGEPVHKQFFAAMADLPFVPGSPISMQALMDAAGGDPLAPVAEGYTLARYVSVLIAEALMSPDAAHFARSLANQIRTEANREGDVEDDFDLDPEPTPFVSTMGLRMWADRNIPGRQYEFVVEDLIPERQVVVIMGETGTGKSFLTNHLALSMSRGIRFFGRRVIKPLGVIWCAYEAAEGANSRMRAYAQHHGLGDEFLPFAALQMPVSLWPLEPNGDLLIREIQGIHRTRFNGFPLGAIVVDTYNAATPGASEIDSEVVSRIRSFFNRTVQETGATLIIVGHTNAAGKHRGNEQLTNNVDTIVKVSFKTQMIDRQVIQLKDDDGREIRTMKVVKQREGRGGTEFDFVLRSVPDGTKNQYGSDRTSCVVEEFGGTASAPSSGHARGPRLSYERTVILHALRAALEEYGEPTPPMLGLPKSIAKVVNAKRWKEAYLAKAPDPGAMDKPIDKKLDNTINKRLRDASNHMQKESIIGRANPFVWIAGTAREDSYASNQPEVPEDFR